MLSTIEQTKGRLSPSLKRLCDEYARDIFGRKGYSKWLYVYSAVAGEFKEGWIPHDYYSWVVVPRTKGGYGSVSHLRGLTQKLFDKNGCIPDILYYTNKMWYSVSYEMVDEAEVKGYLFRDSDTVVFKTDNSSKGKGIQILEKNTFDI